MTKRAAALPLLCLLLASAVSGCAPRDSAEARRRTEGLILKRQIAGLQDLVSAAEKGEIARPDQIALAIEEKLVTDLITANLPIEKVVGGRFAVRITSAEVRFRATTSAVILHARLHNIQHPDRFGEVLLGGGLDHIAISPTTGILVATLALFHLEVERTSGGVLSPIVQAVLTEVGEKWLDAISAAFPPLEIPIRLEQQIVVRGFGDGPVTVAPGRLPLQLSVARVAPLSGRLWIILDAAAGPWETTTEPPAQNDEESSPKAPPTATPGAKS